MATTTRNRDETLSEKHCQRQQLGESRRREGCWVILDGQGGVWFWAFTLVMSGVVKVFAGIRTSSERSPRSIGSPRTVVHCQVKTN